MAGRPKKMAERATELDLLAFALSVEVFASAPPQYRQGDSDPKDAIGALWKRCVSDAIRLSLQIEALAILLRRKAGLPPIPELDADDDTEEGLRGWKRGIDPREAREPRGACDRRGAVRAGVPAGEDAQDRPSDRQELRGLPGGGGRSPWAHEPRSRPLQRRLGLHFGNAA